MNKLNFKIGTIILILGLAGCSHMGAPPSCPDSKGFSCARVDQINSMIDRGELEKNENIGIEVKEQKVSNFNHDDYNNNFSLNKDLNISDSRWGDEKVLQVWIAPYEDQMGNFHEASRIDTVINRGDWSNHPLKEIADEEDMK